MRKFILVLIGILMYINAYASVYLTATTETLELETSASVSTDWAVSYADNTATTFTPGSGQGNVATATTTTIVAAPAVSTQRQIKRVSISNRDASTAQTVVIKKDVSGTEYHLTPSITLLAGEMLLLNMNGEWLHFTATGIIETFSGGGHDPVTITDTSSINGVVTGQDLNLTINATNYYNKTDTLAIDTFTDYYNKTIADSRYCQTETDPMALKTPVNSSTINTTVSGQSFTPVLNTTLASAWDAKVTESTTMTNSSTINITKASYDFTPVVNSTLVANWNNKVTESTIVGNTSTVNLTLSTYTITADINSTLANSWNGVAANNHTAASMVNSSTINITTSTQAFTPVVNATLVANWNAKLDPGGTGSGLTALNYSNITINKPAQFPIQVFNTTTGFNNSGIRFIAGNNISSIVIGNDTTSNVVNVTINAIDTTGVGGSGDNLTAANATVSYRQPKFNFIAGNNISTISLFNDTVGAQVNVTFNAIDTTGVGGSGDNVTVNIGGTVVGRQPIINIVNSTSIFWTGTNDTAGTRVNLTATNRISTVALTGSLAGYGNNSSLTNATGLVFPITSGVYYAYEFGIVFNSSVATTGIGLAMDYPAVTIASATISIPSGADAINTEWTGWLTSANDTSTTTAVQTADINYFGTIKGFILPSADGVLQVRYRSEINASNVTIKQGSYGILTILN